MWSRWYESQLMDFGSLQIVVPHTFSSCVSLVSLIVTVVCEVSGRTTTTLFDSDSEGVCTCVGLEIVSASSVDCDD